jgi:diguanylate cyclase (GGDEF)-like protein
MVAVMGVSMAVILVMCYVALTSMFDAIERAAVSEKLEQVRTLVRKDSQTLGEVNQDYARWNDSNAFVNGRQPTYMDDNFTAASLRNLRIKAVLVVGAGGEALGIAAALDDSGQLSTSLPPAWLKALTGVNALAACASVHDTLLALGPDTLMVARRPVTNSLGTAPSQGCLAFVRVVDADYWADVRQLTGVRARLADTWVGSTLPWQLPRGDWAAETALHPLPGVLHIDQAPMLAPYRWQIIGGVTLALMLVTLLTVGALYALVHIKVVRRLRHAAQLADRYSVQLDTTVTWPNRGRDEIDRLGQSLNELVAQVQSYVQHSAAHDELTGLLNRHGLEDRLTLLSFHENEQRTLVACLIMLDLDNFKSINDGFGHELGDALLRHVAAQLARTVREGDVVARIGGDEFALLLYGIQRPHAMELATRLLSNLRVPLVHHELQVTTTASMGLAFSDGAGSASDLMRNADLAMYQAKQRGRNVWVVFNEGLQVDAQRQSRLVQSLRLALDQGALQVVYQPVVDVLNNRVVSVEALARWSLDGEAISPVEFIPLAEEHGLIGQLGMQVMERACGVLADLRAKGHELTCSVNLSLRQFSEPDLPQVLARAVASHGLPTSAIRLEITESMVADSEPAVLGAMRELHDLGFSFLLDDFGTGQSSLHRLQALPFQTIKIDRSFVVPLQHGDQLMVRTVIDLARALNMDVVAEGVETPVQLAQLLELGVTHIQGFLTARPMSDAALEAWLLTMPPLPIRSNVPEVAPRATNPDAVKPGR